MVYWRIGSVFGMDQERATLKVIYQKGTRSVLILMPRRYEADWYYSVKNMDGKFATNTLFAGTKFIYSNFLSHIY